MNTLDHQCSLAAARLLVGLQKPVKDMNTAELVAYVCKAVTLGAHLAINHMEKVGTQRRTA